MTPLARSAAAVAVSLALILTGWAAAFARGQVTDGHGQVLVLCAQGGLVQVTLDSQGRPTGESRLCPDLAANLMAALSAPLPDAALPRQALRLHINRAGRPEHGRDMPGNSARDPPFLV
ncbi:hypothetical protein [Defluviimonas sp. WL0075]|uniref:Uncharacterized protein n=1 Tax=Albidovulum sediminicola TaxID=2984331 RepID=A0ABT2Z162_9RHOB|nr:hypothetical protein [Defluviimonas sp. WL0075]MCV2864885.1 hypothetical protein [Defluviimonas sp. WL0075]